MSLLHRLTRALVPLALAFSVALRADPIITEFLAANTKTLADSDGDFSDWIELHNPDSTPANLNGWYLTDDPANKRKWQLPALTLSPGSYLIVWASTKDRRDPTKPLHTNFALKGGGEYLALVKPDGATLATEYASYPAQPDDVSYGVTQPTAAGEAAQRGFFLIPTPGARNGGASTLLLAQRVAFSRAAGLFTGTITVTLSGAAAGQRIRYVVAPPAATGATVAEPGPTATQYAGPITISASSIVRATVYSADNLAHGYASTAQYVRLANTGAARLDTFSSQLPLMVIDTHGSGSLVKDNLDHPGWIYTWSKPATGNTTLTGAPSSVSSITTNVRGSSSADFPKKGFKLRFDDTLGHSHPLPLYGLPAFDNWVLVGPWQFDRSYLNNAFVYALSNRLGRWAPRTQFVELFFNADGGDLDSSDYAGIYLLVDSLEVDPQRINIAKLDPTDLSARKITGGYMVKIDVASPDEFFFQTRRGFPGEPVAIIVGPAKDADFPQAQKDYAKNFIQGLDDSFFADFVGGWRQRTHLDFIDRPSWIDHLILNILPENVDGLARSAYLTKDRDGRLTAGPAWDFDRSMGGGDVRAEKPDVWNGPDVSGATEFWTYGWWGVLALDPEFVQAWIDRWQTLRRNELSTASLAALVDSLAAQIGPAAAARDAARWPDNAPRFPGGWQGEVDNTKSWLSRRVAWIDTQFTAAPTASTAGAAITVAPAPGTQLAYTTDGTDPRAINGALANGALLSSIAVTLPIATNLHARSFRPNFTSNVVPSSAWSGPAGGPQSSVLTPRPRLANLSSRGFVGAGESILITGVVVNDTAGKQYLARAVGPALTGFGVAGALAQPVLRILDASGRELARNSGWQSGPDAVDIPNLAKGVGAFPFANGSRDSALLAHLPYGQFTLQIASATTGTGVALAELYEIDPGIGRTINLSTRGLVRAGEGLLIGGVVIRGPAPKRLLIRAVGPTLGAFGVATALPDTVLTLFNSTGTQLATNDDWGTRAGTAATAAEIAAAAASVGAFALPNGSRDSALLLTLPEGSYTAQVTGNGTTEGVILLEIYELP